MDVSGKLGILNLITTGLFFGKAHPMAKTAEKSTTLESGNIYFFFRPKVGVDKPKSIDDVQRLYMVLSPDQEERYRLAVIGQKVMPEPEHHQRYWGFVQAVGRKPEQIRDELGPETYSTRTRGERYVAAAIPAGEGRFRILRHEDHTHLAYALELPKREGQVQKEFEIEDQASYIISVKNPEAGSPAYAGLSEEEKANYPKRLQEVFRGRRFADADPPELLDYAGTEFVLIGSSEDVKDELGVEFKTENETESSADIFKDLKLEKTDRQLKPLFEGKWE